MGKTSGNTICQYCGNVFTSSNTQVRFKPKLKPNNKIRRLLERDAADMGVFQTQLVKRYRNSRPLKVVKCLDCLKTTKVLTIASNSGYGADAQTRTFPERTHQKLTQQKKANSADYVHQDNSNIESDKISTTKRKKRNTVDIGSNLGIQQHESNMAVEKISSITKRKKLIIMDADVTTDMHKQTANIQSDKIFTITTQETSNKQSDKIPTITSTSIQQTSNIQADTVSTSTVCKRKKHIITDADSNNSIYQQNYNEQSSEKLSPHKVDTIAEKVNTMDTNMKCDDDKIRGDTMQAEDFLSITVGTLLKDVTTESNDVVSAVQPQMIHNITASNQTGQNIQDNKLSDKSAFLSSNDDKRTSPKDGIAEPHVGVNIGQAVVKMNLRNAIDKTLSLNPTIKTDPQKDTINIQQQKPITKPQTRTSTKTQLQNSKVETQPQKGIGKIQPQNANTKIQTRQEGPKGNKTQLQNSKVKTQPQKGIGKPQNTNTKIQTQEQRPKSNPKRRNKSLHSQLSSLVNAESSQNRGASLADFLTNL